MVLVLASCSAKYAVRNDSSGNHRAPWKWSIGCQRAATQHRRCLHTTAESDQNQQSTLCVEARPMRANHPACLQANPFTHRGTAFVVVLRLEHHMETLELFGTSLPELPETRPQSATIRLALEEPEARATRRITTILKAGHEAQIAYSAGKDSSAVLSIALNAARAIRSSGGEVPPIYILHSQTGVENPEISALAYDELKKVRAYADKHNLDVTILLGQPALNESWPVRTLGGRALPSFGSTRADCTTDLKIAVSNRLIASAKGQAIASGKGWKAPVLMTGVRNDESAVRDTKIAARGEVAEGIWLNDFGEMRASPILDFDSDDVFAYLAYCSAGVIESYSDFKMTLELYAAASGTSCVIVADMRSAAIRKPCGARTGCWACTRVNDDRSMHQMIDSDEERYSYMRPLARLRDFISHSQYDWSLRQYVGRSISADGHISVAADTYSPAMLRDLFIYTLTAEKLSKVPIISIEQIIAIDARWSMYGLWPPFYALKLFAQVESGRLQEAPVIERVPKSEVPRIGKIYVGTSWYEATGLNSVTGLRDVGMELFHESCGVQLRALANGALVADYEEGDRFDVDAEGAADFLGVLADDYIERYCHMENVDWTEGYRTYLRMGIITVAKGQSRSTDEIMRRTQWRQQHGLHGQQNLQDLIERCTVLYDRQQQLI